MSDASFAVSLAVALLMSLLVSQTIIAKEDNTYSKCLHLAIMINSLIILPFFTVFEIIHLSGHKSCRQLTKFYRLCVE